MLMMVEFKSSGGIAQYINVAHIVRIYAKDTGHLQIQTIGNGEMLESEPTTIEEFFGKIVDLGQRMVGPSKELTDHIARLQEQVKTLEAQNQILSTPQKVADPKIDQGAIDTLFPEEPTEDTEPKAEEQ